MPPSAKGSGQSLQRRLLSSILLAVLTGYASLLGMHALLSRFQRLQAHDRLVTGVLTALSSDPDAALSGLKVGNGALGSPVVTLQPVPVATPPTPPRIRVQGNRHLMESVLGYAGPGGAERRLRVQQDVTEALAAERLTQQLLIVAAGLSTLLTGALLRPILHWGLDQPIERLTNRLKQAQLPPAPYKPLPLESQPLELRSMASAFNSLQQRLGSTWQQQRSFVDGVAHELRTPITLISGYTQRLQRRLSRLERPDPELAHAVAAIAVEVQRTMWLLTDLLELSRFDAGRLELRRSRVDLDDLLLLAYERLEPFVAGRLQLHAPPEGEPRLAWADAERLQQCIGNLVENAVKYAPDAGPIELFVSSEGDHHLLHVRDHGPGVPLGERDMIFERFARGAAASERAGSGIGLAVVLLLLQRMGGTARVQAPLGGGADFQLVLPALPPGASPGGADFQLVLPALPPGASAPSA